MEECRKASYLDRAMEICKNAGRLIGRTATMAAVALPLATGYAFSGEPIKTVDDTPGGYSEHKNVIAVRGTLVDALSGNGVPSAKVKIIYLNNGLVTNVFTDAGGNYSAEIPFNYADDHRFVVEAGKQGWYSYRDTSYLYFPVVSVEEEKPKSFSVHQNCPNPFSSSTRIDFEIEKQGPAKIEIYSADGRLVKRVSIDEALGRYSFEWNRDSDKGYAPLGVYFARLSTPDASQTIKLVALDAHRGSGSSRISHISSSAKARREKPANNQSAASATTLIDTLYTFQRYTDPDNAGSADYRKDLLEWIKWMHNVVHYKMPGILWIHRWRNEDMPINVYLGAASAEAQKRTRDAMATIEAQLGKDMFQEVTSRPAVGIEVKYGPGPSNAAITKWIYDRNKIPSYPLQGAIGLTVDGSGNPLFDIGIGVHEDGHILETNGQHSPFCSHNMSTCSSRQNFSPFEVRGLIILYKLPNTCEKRYLIF